jgi:hypothetical protein
MMADGRTDMKLIVAFSNFVIAVKMGPIYGHLN